MQAIDHRLPTIADQYTGSQVQRRYDAASHRFTVHSLMPPAARRFVRAVVVLPSMHGTTLTLEPDGIELRIVAENPTLDQRLRLKELAKLFEEGIAAGCDMVGAMVVELE